MKHTYIIIDTEKNKTIIKTTNRALALRYIVHKGNKKFKLCLQKGIS